MPSCRPGKVKVSVLGVKPFSSVGRENYSNNILEWSDTLLQPFFLVRAGSVTKKVVPQQTRASADLFVYKHLVFTAGEEVEFIHVELHDGVRGPDADAHSTGSSGGQSVASAVLSKVRRSFSFTSLTSSFTSRRTQKGNITEDVLDTLDERTTQRLTFIGGCSVPLATVSDRYSSHEEHDLYGKDGRVTGMLQMKMSFVPLVREGWLQKKLPAGHRPWKPWKVYWFELLANGMVSFYTSHRKTADDFRGQIYLPSARSIGPAAKYQSEANAQSYMEIVASDGKVAVLETHYLRANHPDDAKSWLRDFKEIWESRKIKTLRADQHTRQQRSLSISSKANSVMSNPLYVSNNAIVSPSKFR